jgi:magnesium-transporting ATPase (P-type)
MGASKPSKAPQEYERHPFQLSVDDIINALQTNTDSGLTAAQASELCRKYGENKLEGEGTVKWYAVLLKQVSNAMILVSTASSFFQLLQGRSLTIM